MIKTSLGVVVIIAVAILLPLGWFSGDVAELVFGWGRMEEAQTEIIGYLLFIGLFSLQLQGVSSVIVAIFNAKRDTKAMIPVNLFAIGFFVTAGWLVAMRWVLAGLMATVVMTYALVMIIQIVLLKRRHGIEVGLLLVDRKFVSTIFIMLAVGVASLLVGNLLRVNPFINVAIAAVVFVILLAVGAKRMGFYQQLTHN
jgi:O-antigen/teichoic acid export membrane protein